MSGEVDRDDIEDSPRPDADELQFGDVRDHSPDTASQTLPQPPDENGHWATVRLERAGSGSAGLGNAGLGDEGSGWARREGAASAAGGNGARPLATEVFIDLDAFLEMQAHAAEDTSIELGGLLLGHRGTRDDGTPWVTICDSLRARHYRATRGSFRFTHDTWADLNLQRAELPESTEIVGWYHTHPGWGVFLSDQDVFICDHFFANSDDVALVIDPTSGDTGLFVRRGTPAGRPPQRLASYFLYTHRRRHADLRAWASFFSGVGTMSNPPAVFPSQHAPPVFITSGSGGDGTGKSWFALAGALLGAQLALGIALLVMLPDRVGGEQRVAETDSLRVREAVVDDLLSQIAAAGPAEATQSWRETALANEQLRASNLGLLSRVESLSGDLEADRRRRQQTNTELAKVREQLTQTQAKLAALTPATGEETASQWGFDWRAALAGGAAGLALGWLFASLLARRSEEVLATRHRDGSALGHEAPASGSERL